MELSYFLWNRKKSLHNESTEEIALANTPVNPKEADKIILLHGMGGTGSLWRPIAASLEDTMDVLAPDQRGHGRSLVPHLPGGRHVPSYTPLDYGKDIVETLTSLHFHPTWILGHSMGVRSAVATAHLLSEPEKLKWIKGLILVDLGFSGVAGGGLGENLAHFIKILPPEFASREEARAFMTENCPDPSIAQYLMAVSVRSPEGKVSFPFDHAALIQTIYAARDASVRGWIENLGAKKLPILVLRGANSLVWSHEQFEQERKHLENYSSIVFKEVENAGHGLPFEQRIAFVKIIQEFMKLNS